MEIKRNMRDNSQETGERTQKHEGQREEESWGCLHANL